MSYKNVLLFLHTTFACPTHASSNILIREAYLDYKITYTIKTCSGDSLHYHDMLNVVLYWKLIIFKITTIQNKILF